MRIRQRANVIPAERALRPASCITCRPVSLGQISSPARTRNSIPPHVADENPERKTKNQNRVDHPIKEQGSAPLGNAPRRQLRIAQKGRRSRAAKCHPERVLRPHRLVCAPSFSLGQIANPARTRDGIPPRVADSDSEKENQSKQHRPPEWRRPQPTLETWRTPRGRRFGRGGPFFWRREVPLRGS